MQVMPSTASAIARRIGVAYSPARLNEPEYNMRLGTAVLQQMTNEQGGSYALTAASYNAGPGRAAQWVGACGDPRGGTTDPTDFIVDRGLDILLPGPFHSTAQHMNRHLAAISCAFRRRHDEGCRRPEARRLDTWLDAERPWTAALYRLALTLLPKRVPHVRRKPVKAVKRADAQPQSSTPSACANPMSAGSDVGPSA